MIQANTLFELTEEQKAQAVAVESIIDEGIQKGLQIDDETKTFSFTTAEISNEIKDEHGGLEIRVRKHVIERYQSANWKVVSDETAGTIVLTAKKPRQPRASKPAETK
jgi:hypothetical protein